MVISTGQPLPLARVIKMALIENGIACVSIGLQWPEWRETVIVAPHDAKQFADQHAEKVCDWMFRIMPRGVAFHCNGTQNADPGAALLLLPGWVRQVAAYIEARKRGESTTVRHGVGRLGEDSLKDAGL